MIDDLILRVSNVEQRCAMTYPVSDAQDYPLERVGVVSCQDARPSAKQKATLCNTYIAWQGHEPPNRFR
jgi:hypothetical protein